MKASRELLDLHRALVAAEREQYERVHGRLPDQQFLDALLQDPELRWLAPLTALVAQMNEVDETQLRDLLRPDPNGNGFQRQYADALQRSADVAVAHGRAISALRETSTRAGR